MKNTLDLMLERRTIMPKEFINDCKLSDEELEMILGYQNGKKFALLQCLFKICTL